MNDHFSSDSEIIRACLIGDRVGQEMLYRKYYPLFMPLCMTYTINSDDACDVFNRAMLKVFQSISTYEGKGDLGAWIRKIVVHEAIDHIRRETRFHATFTSDEVPELGVESDLLDRLSAQDILQVIRKLPGTYRLVLNLYILDGLSHKEISEELNISEGTSKWYLNKARKMLKESLTKLGYETYSL